MSTIMTTEKALAERLRVERESRAWTLAELAERSGISRAMLSKIERGEASPTAALLGRLSAAFGLTMSRLFARIEDQPGGQVAKAADQPAWRDPETGFFRRSLSPGSGSLELVWGELPPGAVVTCPAAALVFIAEQQLVVIAGDLTIIQGGQTHVLAAGDCLKFGPPADVTFLNSGGGHCRYIVAVSRGTSAPAPDPHAR